MTLAHQRHEYGRDQLVRHGKLLAFSQFGVTTKDDLWLLPLDGERKPKPFKQTPYLEKSGQISPDGRWMAYSSDPW